MRCLIALMAACCVDSELWGAVPLACGSSDGVMVREPVLPRLCSRVEWVWLKYELVGVASVRVKMTWLKLDQISRQFRCWYKIMYQYSDPVLSVGIPLYPVRGCGCPALWHAPYRPEPAMQSASTLTKVMKVRCLQNTCTKKMYLKLCTWFQCYILRVLTETDRILVRTLKSTGTLIDTDKATVVLTSRQQACSYHVESFQTVCS